MVPRGELDLATVPVLEAALVAQAGPVVLDLRGLTFVDATGLRLLIQAETPACGERALSELHLWLFGRMAVRPARPPGPLDLRLTL